ncbi:hypothetical protein Tco_1045764 [Tanacetum coccineum]|uniref:Uncharacterized protein n=1 Tax=Tanacetum coccineum TaxID=301880 RepID=A0ABQ5GUR0_9ASTR
MDNTRAQQKALDDELVAPANRLKIGKSNLRLSSNLKSKEPTLQVVLDALKLTPFYKAFEITADVPEIYMQEFWVTVSRHHSSLRFKLNGKRHTVNVDNFRDMLKICPKLPGMTSLFHHNKIHNLNIRTKQVYDAILPQHLTNQAMLESEAYITYHAYATGEKTLKPKSTKKKADSESSPKTSTTQLLRKMNQDLLLREVTTCKNECNLHKSKGLTVLSEVALTEAKQMKIALERSKIQTHNSHASGSGANKGTGIKPGVPDVPTYKSDDEQISWKSSDEEDDDEVSLNDDDDDNDDDEDNDDDDDDADNQDDDDQEDDGQDDDDQDDVNEQTDSDNDSDDFVHPKLSNQDQEIRHNEEESDVEKDKEIQGTNVEEEELDEEETNDEAETNVQTTQVIEDTHVIITPVNPEGQQQSSSVSSGFISNMLNPSPNTGINSIFNRNTESTSLIDVLVTTIVELPLLPTTTLPLLPTPLITHLQQTPVPTPATAPSSSL